MRALHQAWQHCAGHLAAAGQGSAAVTCGQSVLGPLPEQAELRPGLAGKRGNRKPQVWQGCRAADGTLGVLLPGAVCQGCGRQPSCPPDPHSTCRSIPRRGTASPGLILTLQRCCLLQPQPHVPSLCWVRSVTAPAGARRVPAVHPQLTVGPAFAQDPPPSPSPRMQDGPPRASTEWRSAASVLVLQEVQGRGRDPPAKSPGDTPWPKDQAASAQLLSSQAAAVPWSRHATSAGSELPGMAGILPAPHAWLEAAGGPRAELG